MKFNKWTIGLACVALSLTGCISAHKRSSATKTVRDYTTGTNANGSVVALLKREEIYTDYYRDGGAAFLTDPKASELRTAHANQTALGGASTLVVGEFSSSVSSNAAPIITAGGGSVGTIGGKIIAGATGNPIGAILGN